MIPPERLAEIERVVNAGDYPCAYCPDLLTALRVLEKKLLNREEARNEYTADARTLKQYLARALWHWSKLDFGPADVIGVQAGFESWEEIKTLAAHPLVMAARTEGQA